MRQEAVEERLSAILERDWKKEAEVLMEERVRSGVGEVRSYFSFFLFWSLGILGILGWFWGVLETGAGVWRRVGSILRGRRADLIILVSM